MLPVCCWTIPSTPLALSDQDIHVWWASLEPDATCQQALAETLSVEEQQRAARFHFAHDQRRFIVARGLLRMLLGRYLDRPAPQIELSYGPYGKPSLAAQMDQPTLHFNLSHSQDFALYVFSRHRAVGIDLEAIRPMNDSDAIVERFFSWPERRLFQALPAHQKPTAFFMIWTCKEAVLKGLGQGLSLPLEHIDVSSVLLYPNQPEHRFNLVLDTASWCLHILRPADGVAAALAVNGQGRLSCWQWSWQKLKQER